ncbi:MAG: hypothetical protein H6Q72_1431 [Firmicutes bacterium]|nr:hypothetical protein [Bacillota bacterium]
MLAVASTQETMKCQRCGRRIRTQKAMEVGFGKVCHSKYLAEKVREEMKRSQMQLKFDGANEPT